VLPAGTANARRARSGRSSEIALSKDWVDIVGNLGPGEGLIRLELMEKLMDGGEVKPGLEAIGMRVGGAYYLYITADIPTQYLYL
jgi:hypothetical protein